MPGVPGVPGVPVGHGSLADLLPAVAVALDVDLDVDPAGDPAGARAGGTAAPPRLVLPSARGVVVVLVDGLGEVLLRERGGHAPFLRGLHGAPDSAVLSSAYPSTTATSLATLGTGLLPGAHGLVGTEVLDPARGRMFNQLLWDPEVDPRRWQPEPTLFELLAAADRSVTRIGPRYFDGSGLTEAAQRGGRFVAAETLEQRVEAAVAAARAPGRPLVYLYWGDLDKTGHLHGCGSWEWTAELEHVDGQLRRLARALPGDVLLAITADHGMVDVPHEDRIDLATDAELARGVRFLGGEPRAVQLYCEPAAAADVAATWQGRLGAAMTVATRADAVAAGWFGAVAPGVVERIGDVVASAVARVAVVDGRVARPEVLALIGLHGALTDAERLVPLLVTPGLGRS